MPTRRDTLRGIALASAGALIDPGLAAAQRSSFDGAVAGEPRVIEDVRLRWCPPGRFTMGSPLTEMWRRADEAQVEVTLTRGFWMAAFETTQGQWQRIAGAFPDKPPSAAFGLGEAVPMYWVDYAQAEGFCRALTERARRASAITASAEFRLPPTCDKDVRAFGDKSFGRGKAETTAATRDECDCSRKLHAPEASALHVVAQRSEELIDAEGRASDDLVFDDADRSADGERQGVG